MKKFKISLVAVFAILIGIAGSAFSIKPSMKLEDSYFYEYQQTTSAGLMTDANWESIASPEAAGCAGNGVICVVHLTDAPDVNGNPDLSAAGIAEPEDFDPLVDSRKQ